LPSLCSTRTWRHLLVLHNSRGRSFSLSLMWFSQLRYCSYDQLLSGWFIWVYSALLTHHGCHYPGILWWSLTLTLIYVDRIDHHSSFLLSDQVDPGRLDQQMSEPVQILDCSCNWQQGNFHHRGTSSDWWACTQNSHVLTGGPHFWGSHRMGKITKWD